MKKATAIVSTMKHIFSGTKLFLALLLLSTTLFSCSKKDNNSEINSSALVGTWQFAGEKEYFQANGGKKVLLDSDQADATQTIEFKSDGSFNAKWGPDTENGTYKLTGNSLYIKYTNAELGDGTATILTLNNSTLVFEFKDNGTDDNGVTGTFYYEQSYTKK